VEKKKTKQASFSFKESSKKEKRKKKTENKFLAILDKTSNVACLK
jgi:hypothetical protein